MRGRLIYKEYKTMKGAERFVNRLYNEFNHVRLVDFPKNSEQGVYVFEVEK